MKTNFAPLPNTFKKEINKKMNLIIWIALVVTPIATGMFVSGGLGQFIDPPSVFITILPTIGAMIVGFKGYFISSITSVWKKDVDHLTLAKGVEFWKASKRYAIAFSFLGFMIGLIAMLGSGTLEDFGKFGPYLAVASITILYGFIWGYVVADPIACSLETKKEVIES